MVNSVCTLCTLLALPKVLLLGGEEGGSAWYNHPVLGHSSSSCRCTVSERWIGCAVGYVLFSCLFLPFFPMLLSVHSSNWRLEPTATQDHGNCSSWGTLYHRMERLQNYNTQGHNAHIGGEDRVFLGRCTYQRQPSADLLLVCASRRQPRRAGVNACAFRILSWG